MYWDNVLNEVLNKNNPNYSFSFTSVGHDEAGQRVVSDESKTTTRRSSIVKSYELGENYPGIYLTRREAECMYYVMRGKTMTGVAQILDLSPRTVTFYLNNIKKKLEVRKKSDLIEKMFNSDFLSKVDFA